MKKILNYIPFRPYSSGVSTNIVNQVVRTRFAPSPTGFLHLGSLRTALYNYLLAKSFKNGKFILRIEDTDQKRYVEGAEENIIDSLNWCGFKIDEGPFGIGGNYGPYKQSERQDIYSKYAKILLDKGLAYKCYCSKERLEGLQRSAKLLKPPTTVTYDRKCIMERDDADQKEYVIRFKSPDSYPSFHDELHGDLNLQPQYNYHDRRYDDFVILKNDGMPTYHFASVVDDHLMEISHVIRGEEWLPSTPKHLALYSALQWTPPKFIHIPLLTSMDDKKLSKRNGDLNIYPNLKNKGILPEALINFVVLFGWSPSRKLGEKFNEFMSMDQLMKLFNLKNLTKGNAKVNNLKLYYFNKLHLENRFKNDFDSVVDEYWPTFQQITKGRKDRHYLVKLLTCLQGNLNNINEVGDHLNYLLKDDLDYKDLKIPNKHIKQILQIADQDGIDGILNSHKFKKKDIFMSLRYALSGNNSGLTIPQLIELLDENIIVHRVKSALIYLNTHTW